jgi:hypothetical protein
VITLVLVSHPYSLTMSNISALRRRRGIVRTSIARLTNRLKDLEKDADRPATHDLARGITRELDALDSDFCTHHHVLIDSIDHEKTLQREQTTLDEHDDFVAELAACNSSTFVPPRRTPRLVRLHLGDCLTYGSPCHQSMKQLPRLIKAWIPASYDNMMSNSSISRRN